MMSQLTTGLRSSHHHVHKLCNESCPARRLAASVDRHVPTSKNRVKSNAPHSSSSARSSNSDHQHPGQSPSVAVHATSSPAASTEESLTAEDPLIEIASGIMELLGEDDLLSSSEGSPDSFSDGEEPFEGEYTEGEEGEMFAERREVYVEEDADR